MRNILAKIKDPTFWLGGAVAITSINWTSVAPMGSQSWWISGAAFVAGIVAAIMKNPGSDR